MEVNHSKLTKDLVLGNGLAAGKDLDVGEAIIQVREPLVIVVEKNALERVCSFCLLEQETASLKRCTRCMIARYCSAGCQKMDWKLIHKNECSLLKKLPEIPPTPVRALYQVLLHHSAPGTGLDPRSAGLEHHVQDFMKDEKRWDEIVLQAKAATEFSKSPPSKVEVVATLLCIMATNAFRATLPDDAPIGLCYEPSLALANHSCTPNAFIMFDGRCISLIALNPIKKDEDIFISYIDFTQSRHVRREELRKRYFFDCNCEKCANDDSPYEEFLKAKAIQAPGLGFFIDHGALVTNAESRIVTRKILDGELKSLSPVIAKVYGILEQKNFVTSQAESLDLLKRTLSDLSVFRTNRLFALPPYPTVIDELYLTYVDNDRLPSALILLLFLFLNCDVYNWPQPNHPVRVTRLFTIARLLKYVASIEPATLGQNLSFVPKEILESIDFINTVHAVLILVNEFAPLSHGKDATFLRRVQEEMREVEEVQRLRGGTGEVLRKWQSNPDSQNKGTLIVRRIFDGLKTLAGFGFAAIESQVL